MDNCFHTIEEFQIAIQNLNNLGLHVFHFWPLVKKLKYLNKQENKILNGKNSTKIYEDLEKIRCDRKEIYKKLDLLNVQILHKQGTESD